MDKIAIYGGAFNPPTLGHKEVIKQTLVARHVDKIIFSPDGRRKDKDFGISDTQRIQMIEIFASEMADMGLNIEFCDYFLKKEGHTATLDVDRYFQEKLGTSPYHIFGIDTVSTMPRRIGNENGYIQNHVKKIFIQRKGFEMPKDFAMQNYILLDLNILEISSTVVRNMIQNKLRVDHILTPQVYDYVMEHKLYT